MGRDSGDSANTRQWVAGPHHSGWLLAHRCSQECSTTKGIHPMDGHSQPQVIRNTQLPQAQCAVKQQGPSVNAVKANHPPLTGCSKFNLDSVSTEYPSNSLHHHSNNSSILAVSFPTSLSPDSVTVTVSVSVSHCHRLFV